MTQQPKLNANGHPVEDDRFSLREELGRGGLAVVYRALDHYDDTEVAIKLARTDRPPDPNIQERFRREGLALLLLKGQPGGFSHAEFGTYADDLPYVSMEVVDGRSLRELLEPETAHPRVTIYDPTSQGTLIGAPDCLDDASRRAPSPIGEGLPIRPDVDSSPLVHLPYSVCIEYAVRIAEALHYAHEIGIIHRDVKPGNVLITEKGRLHLIDYGLCHHRFEDVLERAGQTVGSPRYVSPEQIRDSSSVDSRTDLYSLGVILFEMLTGRAPFERPNPVAIIAAHIKSDVPDILRAGKPVPPELGDIARRLLQKHPDERYQGAGEVIVDFGKAIRAGAYE